MDGDEFGPGDLLPSERDLMDRFKVGRPAVREAMQSLQVSGLIDIRHGERARVAQPSIPKVFEQLGDSVRHLLASSSASLEHMKDARLSFEKAMAAQAAQLRTNDDIERLHSILELQNDRQDDTQRFLSQDREFHRVIASISGNAIYPTLADGMYKWLTDFDSGKPVSSNRKKQAIDEHAKILSAIVDGDSRQADKEMHNHLTRVNGLYHKTAAPTD